MLRSIQGARHVSRITVRPLVSLALIGAFAAALTLAGCGRKGALDPPPAASVTGEQGKAAGASGSGKNQPPNKSFLLDPLLN
jgi:predicted small lipoprotein YifL